ncbi:universal stress protein A [Nitrosospira multiformis]|uniref:Universal stress protein n=1 Tax=Nitrosospira multiformis TaxID=1231 RepID=A0A1H9YVX1_9PROT|nr:universal stress protein [Nitrosospira multiformis]SES73283.1 universal stress protein A [Nitrosospira multiformis]
MIGSYRHILLAVDFSEHGNHVIRKARYLAETFQAKLSIIHVLDNIPMPDMAYGTIVPLEEYSAYELLEAEKKKLEQVADRLGVDVRQRWLVWGVPAQEIVRVAEQEQVDLIIVGSHGRHGLALLLGSTANSVLHHAKCDVIAIRLQDEVTSEESILERSALDPLAS